MQENYSSNRFKENFASKNSRVSSFNVLVLHASVSGRVTDELKLINFLSTKAMKLNFALMVGTKEHFITDF